jgi:hypothetical protein
MEYIISYDYFSEVITGTIEYHIFYYSSDFCRCPPISVMFSSENDISNFAFYYFFSSSIFYSFSCSLPLGFLL